MNIGEYNAFLAWSDHIDKKVKQAESLIIKAVELGHHYIACSWGKDSTVMLHIAQQLFPNILTIFISTPYDDMLDNYTQVSNKYREQFKTNYLKIELDNNTIPKHINNLKLWIQYPIAIIGVRAEESKQRKITIIKNSPIYQYQSGKKAGSYRIFPLAYWTYQDIWAYIVKYKLPYLASYDHQSNANKERSRTTNVLPLSKSLTRAKTEGRIARIKRISPEAYQEILNIVPEIASIS